MRDQMSSFDGAEGQKGIKDKKVESASETNLSPIWSSLTIKQPSAESWGGFIAWRARDIPLYDFQNNIHTHKHYYILFFGMQGLMWNDFLVTNTFYFWKSSTHPGTGHTAPCISYTWFGVHSLERHLCKASRLARCARVQTCRRRTTCQWQ
jgi:hypothetical protein